MGHGYFQGLQRYQPCLRVTYSVQIVAVPYNMILSRATRDAVDIDLSGALVIFDEAHNVLDTINELQSCEIGGDEISRLSEALRHYIDKFERRLSPSNLVLCQQLQQICVRIDEFMNKCPGDVLSVNEFVRGCQIDHINMLKIVEYIRASRLSVKLTSYYQESHEGDVKLLNSFGELLAALVAADTDGRLLFSPMTEMGRRTRLRYVSLRPATVMEEICATAHSVILAGGTMKPIDDIVKQLFSPFLPIPPSVFSCGHLSGTKDNICGVIVGSGPGGIKLNFTHSTWQDDKLMAELSQTINNICNVVPDGVVCFFPSFTSLDHFIASWSNRTLKKQVNILN